MYSKTLIADKLPNPDSAKDIKLERQTKLNY